MKSFVLLIEYAFIYCPYRLPSMGDTPWRLLILITGDSAKNKMKPILNYAWFFKVHGVLCTVTQDIRKTISNLSWPARGLELTYSKVTQHWVNESYTLQYLTGLYWLFVRFIQHSMVYKPYMAVKLFSTLFQFYQSTYPCLARVSCTNFSHNFLPKPQWPLSHIINDIIIIINQWTRKEKWIQQHDSQSVFPQRALSIISIILCLPCTPIHAFLQEFLCMYYFPQYSLQASGCFPIYK